MASPKGHSDPQSTAAGSRLCSDPASEYVSIEECNMGEEDSGTHLHNVTFEPVSAATTTVINTAPAIASAEEDKDNMNLDSSVLETDLTSNQSEVRSSTETDFTTFKPSTRHVNISDLPDEILIKILSYLSFSDLIDTVQNVCYRWRNLSQDAELWYNKVYVIRSWCCTSSATCRGDKTDEEAVHTLHSAPQLRTVFVQRGAKSYVFRALASNCRELTSLQIGAAQKLSYSVLKNLVEKCSKIHTLRISNRLLGSEKFVEAVSHLQHLRVLHLEEYSMNDTHIHLRPLADGCPQLSEIDFGHMYYDIDELKYFLTAKKKNLKYIGIRWTMEARRCIVPLLTVCADTLERLELYQYDVLRDEAREAFLALGRLHTVWELTSMFLDPSVASIIPVAFRDGGLSALKVLDLWDSYGLADEAIVAICRGCPALREMKLRNAAQITDAAFSQIHRLKHLQMLDLASCENLGSGAMPYIARLPQLRALLMEGMDFGKLEPGLTCILDLVGLRCLNLTSSKVRPVPFDRFPDKLVNLRELHVENCEGDPSVVDDLRERMPELQIYGSIREEAASVYTESDFSDGESGDEDNAGEEDAAAAAPPAPAADDGGNEEANENSESYCGSDGYSDTEDFDVSLLFLENAMLERPDIDWSC